MTAIYSPSGECHVSVHFYDGLSRRAYRNLVTRDGWGGFRHFLSWGGLDDSTYLRNARFSWFQGLLRSCV